MKTYKPATQAAHALGHMGTDGAIVPGIEPASTYLRDENYGPGRTYARADNPGFEPVEDLLTALEGGAASLLFASGMAAATAVFQVLSPGDHVIAPQRMYWALRGWLTSEAARWGLVVQLVETHDQAALAAALRPGKTKLVWIETPANPDWTVTDIAATARAAHQAGALLAVDSTCATPVLTRPIEHGADLVMHSATKYLNGHSDVIAGTLTTARMDDLWARLVVHRARAGAIAGPFEAWLIQRGMRTLFLRVRQACTNARAVADHFARHGRVAAVLYPGLADFPGHDVARRQMSDFGGMLSLRLGSEATAHGVASRVKLWRRATSLGGVESLIEHRALVEGPGTLVPRDLLRLSAGIEDAGDLIEDLEQALAASN